jgi:hypothetical protein
VIIIVISLTSGLVIMALLISLFVVAVKSNQLKSSITWFTPQSILWPLGYPNAGQDCNPQPTVPQGTTLGPVLISYSSDLQSVWTVNGSSLTTQSVSKANPKTQYWSIVAQGNSNAQWYPFIIMQEANNNNQITTDGTNVTLGTSGNWAQIDNDGGSCGTLQINTDVNDTSAVWYIGPGLTVVAAPQTSTDCGQSVPIFIGVLPTTSLTFP